MRVLVVDDDELIVNLIEMNLKMEGYTTQTANDGVEAMEQVNEFKPDLIILDIMMPRKDGYHVCRELQGRNIPIIMLTAKDDISDKLMGLEMGADDYMVKPFDSRELTARVKAVFRRMEKTQANAAGEVAEDESGPGVRIDEKKHIVLAEGKEIGLTPIEYDLLLFLYQHPQMVFSRDQLLDRVWGYDYLGDSRTVDIHIQRLRKKLGSCRECVETVFGVGYKYREKSDEA